jgi:hypothetical protein
MSYEQAGSLAWQLEAVKERDRTANDEQRTTND